MTELGRVNLLVGTNNCGKTSVLEAVHILAAQGRPSVLWETLARRGERSISERTGARMLVSDVRHLFYGHECKNGDFLEISGKNDVFSSTFSAKIIENNNQTPLISEMNNSRFDESEILSPLNLEIQWLGDEIPPLIMPFNNMTPLFKIPQLRENTNPIRFITTSALNKSQVIADFDNISLTPDENIVIQSLKTIEPNIERIASVTHELRNSYEDRGGMVVKLANQTRRIPIGSMGDGIWRMLGIALSLVNARGGTLLIDEIDTGLHFSAMENMWRLVKETATRLDVQVFATTHSRDCYEALAAISRPDVFENSDISIQRIERGKQQATFFTEQEIVIAAESAIEVR